MRAIFRRKWLIAAIVAIGTAFSLFAAFRTRDAYQAYAVISVGKEDTAVIKVREGDLVVQNDESLRTKMYLLQSNPLVEEVIVNLKLDRSEDILNPGGRTLKETFGSLSEGVKKVFQGRRNISEPAPNMPDSLSKPTNVGAIDPQYSPAESWRLAPFVENFRQNLMVEPVSDARLKNLPVEQISEMRLLKIAYTHPDPALAAAICNQLAQTLINHNTENKSEKLKGASTWLDRSTRELKARAERAEQALANYTRAHNNIAPQGKGSLSADRLLRLQAEVTRAETDRIVKESLYEDVKTGARRTRPRGLLRLESWGASEKARRSHGAGRATRRELRPRQPANHRSPAADKRHQEADRVPSQVAGSQIEARLRSRRPRRTGVQAALEEAKDQTAKENVDTFQYGILQQEVDTTKALYRNFLEKSSEAKFELAQQQNNLRVVEPARAPRTPTGPNRTLWTMIGFALSLTLGVGLALLLEFLDRSIKSAEDLSRRLQFPHSP